MRPIPCFLEDVCIKIVIIGAGKIGATLADQLLREGHEITVVDRSAEALDTISTLDVMTVEGNGITLQTLREAGVDTADLAIAVMSTDEENLLACLIAKKLGVGNTIARVRNPEYAEGIRLVKDDLGLSMALNPELASASEIARILRAPSAIKIDTFSKGRVELHKVRLPDDSPLDGLKLMELGKMHSGVLICAVERGAHDVYIPSGNFALKAESPGPSVSKMVPKMRTSALILYGIYCAMTLLQICAYQLGNLFGWGEISLFDSVCLTFGSAGTGGFAVRNDGLASYAPYIQSVTTVAMILFGVNFSIYFFLICRKFRLIGKNSELKCYLAIILFAIALISLNLTLTGGFFPSVGQTLHHVSFSVGSILTTTGFSTVDFSQWPELSKMVLMSLMVIGACAGSTGGGIKVSRLLILFKSARSELRRLLHPHRVEVMTMDGKRVSSDVIRGTNAFLIFYLLIALTSMLLVSLDGMGTETTVTAVLATLNNIGPGTSILIGPAGNYADFSALSKVVLSLDMLFGRLELFPMLILLRPSTWRKH